MGHPWAKGLWGSHLIDPRLFFIFRQKTSLEPVTDQLPQLIKRWIKGLDHLLHILYQKPTKVGWVIGINRDSKPFIQQMKHRMLN